MNGFLNSKMSPRLLFLFVILMYLIVFGVLVLNETITTRCVADECGYIQFSKNLLQGFYSPPSPEIDLWWGPGYPLFLTPFLALDFDRVGLVLVNVALSLGAIHLLYKTARLFLAKRDALIVSAVWALYFIHYPFVFSALSEPLTTLLILFIAYSFLRPCNGREELIFHLLCGLSLGLLILTKVIFSYVCLILGLLALFMYCFSSLKKISRKSLFVLGIGFLVTFPYQFYTYGLTGKLFYFSNAGGSALYFMTSPHPGEFGEWNNSNFTVNCGYAKEVPCNSELFARNHKKVFSEAKSLPPIERDEFLKAIALENIKNNPIKYFKNYVNNFSRMLFNIPNSYFYQREQTIIRLLPNSIIFTLIIFSFFYTIFNWRRFPVLFCVIVTFVLSYISVHLFVSSEPRHFNVALPVILIWIALTLRISISSVLTSQKLPSRP